MAQANVQQVRYKNPEIPPWQQGLAYGAQGLSHYYERRDRDQQNMLRLLPVLAQMRMLQPGGPLNVPGVPGGFRITQPATDWADAENQMDVEKANILLGKKPIPEAMIQAQARATAEGSKAYQDALMGYTKEDANTVYNKVYQQTYNQIKADQEQIFGKKTPAPAATTGEMTLTRDEARSNPNVEIVGYDTEDRNKVYVRKTTPGQAQTQNQAGESGACERWISDPSLTWIGLCRSTTMAEGDIYRLLARTLEFLSQLHTLRATHPGLADSASQAIALIRRGVLEELP